MAFHSDLCGRPILDPTSFSTVRRSAAPIAATIARLVRIWCLLVPFLEIVHLLPSCSPPNVMIASFSGHLSPGPADAARIVNEQVEAAREVWGATLLWRHFSR
jgi:hypothetical protein